MEEIWIVSSDDNYNVINFFCEKKSIYLTDISHLVYDKFQVHPIYQRFYYKGQKVYELTKLHISPHNPLGLTTIQPLNPLILTIILCDVDKTYQIAISNHTKKTLYNAFIELKMLFDLGNYFNTSTFIIQTQSEFLSIKKPLNSIQNHTVLYINKNFSDKILIFIYDSLKNTQIPFTVQNQLIISELKHFIGLSLSLKQCNISLQNSSFPLESSLIISNTLVENDQVYIDHFNIGGSLHFFQAPDFSIKKTAVDSENAPEWRLVKPGLSFIFKCFRENCKANEQIVIAHMGFVVCDYKRLQNRVKCPACMRVPRELPTKFGLCMCRLEYCGKVRGRERKGSICENKRGFDYYDETSEEKWSELTLTCLEIDEDLDEV